MSLDINTLLPMWFISCMASLKINCHNLFQKLCNSQLNGGGYGFFWALITRKSLLDSNRGCTMAAARMQPPFRSGRQSEWRQYGLEHSCGAVSSNWQFQVISVWCLCSAAQGLSRKWWWWFSPETTFFFVDYLMLVKKDNEGAQITPCVRQSIIHCWTHCTTRKTVSLTEHHHCKYF